MCRIVTFDIRINNHPKIYSESRLNLGLDNSASETGLTSPGDFGLLCVFGLTRASDLNGPIVPHRIEVWMYLDI